MSPAALIATAVVSAVLLGISTALAIGERRATRFARVTGDDDA